MVMVFDASSAPVGRLAALTAKQLLLGEQVTVIHAEKAVFTGDPDFVTKKYSARRQMTDKANPDHAAKWPRRPDLFLRRVIRGMLPKRATRRKQALSRLRVYLGAPENVSDAHPLAAGGKQSRSVITVGEVCRKLGWTPLTE